MLCIWHYVYIMKRTTLMLPSTLREKATSYARQRRMSFGEFVRRALEKALQETEQSDTFLNDKALFRGKVPKDLAKNHDKYLYGDD